MRARFEPTPSVPTPRTRVGRFAWSSASFVLYWIPVWVPLLLLWQVAQRGLEPTMVELRRLAAEEVAVYQRHSATKTRFERMEAEVVAWSDPVYRERLRRLRLAEPERQGQ